MEELTNEDILKAVCTWQTCGFVHPLTCGNDSNHQVLYPVIRNNKVILKCADCTYTQSWIPDPVLKIYSIAESIKKEYGHDRKNKVHMSR